MKVVLRVADDCLVTLYHNSQVISVQRFDVTPELMDRVYSFLAEFNIEEITLLMKPNLRDTLDVGDDPIISFYDVNGARIAHILSEQDSKSLKVLSSLFNLSLVKIVTSLDLYQQIHSADSVILVDDYLGGEVLVTCLDKGKILSLTVTPTQELKKSVEELSATTGITSVVLFKEGLREISGTLFDNLDDFSLFEYYVVGESLLAARGMAGTPFDVGKGDLFSSKKEVSASTDALTADDGKINLKQILESLEEEPEEDNLIPEKAQVPEKIKISEEPAQRPLIKDKKSSKSSDKEKLKPKQKKLGIPRKSKKDSDDQEDFIIDMDDEVPLVPQNKIKKKKSEVHITDRDNRIALITLALCVVIGLGMVFPKIKSDNTFAPSSDYPSDYIQGLSLNLNKMYTSQGEDGMYLDVYKKLSSVEGATIASLTVTKGQISVILVSPTNEAFEGYKNLVSQYLSVVSLEELPLSKEDPVSYVRKQLTLK